MTHQQNYCDDCGGPARHWSSWVDGIVSPVLEVAPSRLLSKRLERKLNNLMEAALVRAGVFSWQPHFTKFDVPIRTICFVEEAKKRGITAYALKGPYGFMNFFKIDVRGKDFPFEALPVADFISGPRLGDIDDKSHSKKKLEQGQFPALKSKNFWFFQKKSAIEFAKKIGFPVVVKPRNGSYSRHITTNISNESALDIAISKALEYGPSFIVEKYLDNVFVYRATVIDFDFCAVTRRTPAHVVGDGVHSVEELVTLKNSDPERGEAHEEAYVLFKVVVDKASERLLHDQGMTMTSLPKAGQMVFLQKDPFIRLGADSDEVTDVVHPDNLKLFKDIAKFFDVRVVGLDFLCADIAKSWKEQECAILELNSLPCIEVHHYPSSGKPQNVAGAIVDLVFKYYK